MVKLASRWTVLAIAIWLVLVGGSPAIAEVFKPTRYVLENGLELVVIEDHRRPVVAHFIYYRVGSMDEE
ncbi:MAG: hypothetical protein VW714_07945, partial [Rhodospirillales bacterium]